MFIDITLRLISWAADDAAVIPAARRDAANIIVILFITIPDC